MKTMNKFILILLLLITIKGYSKPDSIVYSRVAFAISRLETGNFKSILCKKYNNYFGFRISGRKLNIGKTKKGYAIYANKSASYLDYLIFERKLIKKFNIKSENEFLWAIKKVYATDKNYIKKLKKLM